jgi:carboxyl-terminal processing protease
VSRTRGSLLGLALALAALASSASDARAQGPPQGLAPDPAVYEEAWALLRDNFYDRNMHGVDWNAARLRHLPKAKAARTQEEVHEAILDLVAELKASHAQIVEEDIYKKHYDHEAKSLLAPTYGVRIARLQDGWFVAETIHGAPASAAGLLRGDEVLEVGGRPVAEAGLRPLGWDPGIGATRYYVLPTSRAGERLSLKLRRFARPKGQFDITLTSAEWNEVEGCRLSRRVVERCGLRIGYIRLYHLLSEEPVELLLDLVRSEQLDGLVVDLRGTGGLPSAIERVLDAFDPNAKGGPVWSGKPMIGLIDADTRSAKEILAFYWRRRGLGTLVGTKTAGAVIGAQFKPLSDGAQLLMPGLDMRTSTGGVNIEGHGVKPDVEVETSLPYAEGFDPIIARGLEVAVDQAMAVRRRGLRSGWY